MREKILTTIIIMYAILPAQILDGANGGGGGGGRGKNTVYTMMLSINMDND